MKDGGLTKHLAWRVVPADFVTIDTGTGIVHQAPAFGEVDFDLLQAEQATVRRRRRPADLICSVAPDGTFTAETPEYQGRWVKDCDRDIIRQLKAEGTLFHQEQYVHDYPFCWRAEEDPLIQYPRKSWFIRTTAFKEKMLANNSRINWLPEHIRDGRFGNFLETNVDWALSRERYWGTPLPIWVCEKTGYAEAVGSYAELLAKPGVAGTEVWEKAKTGKPRAARRSVRPQAVHRRGDLRLAEGHRGADAAGVRGDRLLVRLRGDAVRPVGISEPARLARAIPRPVSRRLHQRGPRSDPRLVLQPAGDQHAAVWRRRRGTRGEGSGASAKLQAANPKSLIHSPLSTLHSP